MCHGVWVRIHPPVFCQFARSFRGSASCTRAKSSSAWQLGQHDLMVCFRHFVCPVQVCKKRCCSTIFGSFQDLCKLCVSSCIVCFEDQRPLVPISGFSCGHIRFAKRCGFVASLGSFFQFQCGLVSCRFLYQLSQSLRTISRFVHA